MSLNWNVSRIVNHDEVCWYTATEDVPSYGIKAGEQYLSPITNALIWATMSVGLGAITAANAGEFYARLNLLEKLDGNRLIRAEVDGERPSEAASRITPDEVRQHIGLSCNVSDETRAAWLKRLGHDLDTAARRYADAAKKAELASA